MTREERRQIMNDAVDRAYDEVARATSGEMDTPEFRTLIKNIMDMEWLARPDFRDDGITPTKPDAPVEQVTEEPAADPFAPAPVEPTAAISKDELRDKLSTYSNKHDSLDVAAIMNGMGYSKLSDVPTSQYAALLEKVEAAIAEVV